MQDLQCGQAEDLFPYAGPSFFSRLYQLYPASNFNSTFFQRQTWYGDFIINCELPFLSQPNPHVSACRS